MPASTAKPTKIGRKKIFWNMASNEIFEIATISKVPDTK
jgi:hypothetical protein